MKTLGEWLSEAPFSLAMSAGYFGFFAHTGVLSVLEDEGLLPREMSGASAGALVTGAWAAGLSARELAKVLMALERHEFWDPRPGFGLLAGEKFRRKLETMLPAQSFAECRVPLSVSVFDLGRRRTRAISSGALAPAIVASCALPVLFQPVKHAGGWLSDGGILDRPGLFGVAPGTRVLHQHLASQSPWRRADAESMQVPRREGLTALVIEGLPRPGPFALKAGHTAYEAARLATQRALSSKIDDGVVRLRA